MLLFFFRHSSVSDITTGGRTARSQERTPDFVRESQDLDGGVVEDWTSQDLTKTCPPKTVSEDHFCQIDMTVIVVDDVNVAHELETSTVVSISRLGIWMNARYFSQNPLPSNPACWRCIFSILHFSDFCLTALHSSIEIRRVDVLHDHI